VTSGDEEQRSLRERAERALNGVDIGALFTQWRRVIGPRPEQMGELARQAVDALVHGEVPTPEQIQALEQAIRLLRPAPYVQHGALKPLTADTAKAFPGWEAFREAVKPFLPSVGRIDRARRPGGGYEPVGTCFVVGQDCVVTNHHVLLALTFSTGALARGQAVVRFGQELGDSPEPPPIHLVATVKQDESLDLAMLSTECRLDTNPPGLQPISTVSAEPTRGTSVVAVGYPMDDANLPELVSGLFDEKFQVKRASPGEVLSSRSGRFSHDCTTLSGSSGSPLLTMDGAQLAGVHTDGLYLGRNHAISGEPLRSFLSEPD
jgi:Trypsin-like peptidase domain